jgi:RND family efflux transporter MFP subunit
MFLPRLAPPAAPVRRFRRLSPLLALLFCAPLGCGRAAPPEETPPPAVVKWLETAPVSNLEEWTELIGTTTPLPDRVARISTSVDGKVSAVLPGPDDKRPGEGKKIDAGTVVVQLDTSVIEKNIASAEQKQTQAQLAVKLAEVEVERIRTLLKDPATAKLIPAAEREKADVALLVAQSQLDAAGKDVEALKAQRKLYTLTAPITGRLGRIQVVPGQALGVGAAVADVVDIDDKIDALCFVPPSLVGRLRTGQQAFAGPVDKDPNALAEVEADGEVVYIAEQAEPETGNFAVKVRFDNKGAHLRANRVLRLRVRTQPGKECVSLEEKAIQEDTDPPTVVVVTDIKTRKNDEGKLETVGIAHRMQVTLGRRDRVNKQVEIISLTDPEKEPDKPKLQIDVKDAKFVVEGAQGVQTGDVVKLDVDED